MSLIDLISSKGIDNKLPKIGIGLGSDSQQNSLILKAVKEFLKDNNAKIFLFGKNKTVTQFQQLPKEIFIIKAQNIEEEIFKFLQDKKIDSVIRGSLSSSKFISEIKNRFNVKKLNRLALLETVNGFQFFFAPVGIDECNTMEEKKIFITNAISFLTSIGINPKISILSGGRIGDKGRNKIVDKTLEDGEHLIEFFNHNYPSIDISHDEILIENAIERKANLIIAPNGISGNLIYRTLVHLGGGKAYAAIYLNLEKLIIDTSRVGNISEIVGALLMSKAFSK
ncbi:MAG: phosphotransacetylase [Promethearchaeota archaeon]|nr:MAG: phosphotransacetylase [Candidatus Lokiarchaeota archaeon]